jgi:DMSO/TMAO reductase YedYZ molybdopterin-dependent catalytic subunit
MINEENDHSCGLEAIPSTSTESNLETVSQAVGSKDGAATAPVFAKTREATESIEQLAGADGSPSSPLERALQTDEAISPITTKQEMVEAGPELASPFIPKAIEKSKTVEVMELPADAEGPPPLSTDHEPRMAEAASSAVVTSVSEEEPQGFFAEQPLPIIEAAPWVLRYRTRRDLLLFGAGAVAAAAGAGLLLPQATLGRLGVKRNINPRGKEWLLDNALRIDDDAAEALYSQNRMVPTYTKSQITPIKNNYNGFTPDPSYVSGWHLTLDGLASGLSVSLDIRNLANRFQVHDQITRFICVEGWTAIAWWAGLRFDDLLRAYPPMSQAKWARVESSVNLDNSGNLDPYFVSIDLATARHPQTLLATHHDGQPLTVEHGAPLRLLVPVKLGLKNVKAITRITYSAKEPRDYWKPYGYSSYDGI